MADRRESPPQLLRALCLAALISLTLAARAHADSTDVAGVAISCTDVRSGVSLP